VNALITAINNKTLGDCDDNMFIDTMIENISEDDIRGGDELGESASTSGSVGTFKLTDAIYEQLHAYLHDPSNDGKAFPPQGILDDVLEKQNKSFFMQHEKMYIGFEDENSQHEKESNWILEGKLFYELNSAPSADGSLIFANRSAVLLFTTIDSKVYIICENNTFGYHLIDTIVDDSASEIEADINCRFVYGVGRKMTREFVGCGVFGSDQSFTNGTLLQCGPFPNISIQTPLIENPIKDSAFLRTSNRVGAGSIKVSAYKGISATISNSKSSGSLKRKKNKCDSSGMDTLTEAKHQKLLNSAVAAAKKQWILEQTNSTNVGVNEVDNNKRIALAVALAQTEWIETAKSTWAHHIILGNTADATHKTFNSEPVFASRTPTASSSSLSSSSFSSSASSSSSSSSSTINDDIEHSYKSYSQRQIDDIVAATVATKLATAVATAVATAIANYKVPNIVFVYFLSSCFLILVFIKLKAENHL